MDGAHLTAYLSEHYGAAAWSAHELLIHAWEDEDPEPMGRAFMDAYGAAVKALEAFAKICDAEHAEAQYTLQGGQ